MSQAQVYEKVQYGSQTSAYATEAGTYTELGRVQSIDIPSENNLILDRGLGEGINASNVYYGPFNTSGNVNFDVIDFNFLQHWIGNRAGSGTSGDKYTLTEATSIDCASAAAGKLIVFSIERVNDTESTKSVDFAVGCVGTKYNLSGSIGTKLNCSADFIGRHSGYRATGTTYTPITDPAFVMINGTWKWGASPTEISGVRSFQITADNGIIEDTRSIESRFRGIPVFGRRAYTYKVDIIMATALATTIINDFYGYVNSGTYTPETGSVSVSPTSSLELKIEFVNGSEYAYIQLDGTTINRISKPTAMGGGLSILTFEGFALSGLSNVPITWWTA